MEGTEVKKRGRGRPRKRRREDEEKENSEKKLRSAIKQALENGWKPLVGRYVLKEFEGSGVFLGKIIYYDSGLYRVDYEDGDCEDLDSGEVREILVADENFNSDLSDRRKKLDDMLKSKSSKSRNSGKEVEIQNGFEMSTLTELMGGNDDLQGKDDVDSSSDSCENMQGRDLGLEVGVPYAPPPELLPSSGTIGVPEEYVSHLFSIYGFLRSFNMRLFLSPFTLDDLVGAVNCCVQNTLLDAIHVALLRALRHHLETLSSDGSELASKCLSCIDWSLLDSLTWPVYLLHYFTMMGYAKGPEWKGFHDDLLKRDYFSLSVTWKLKILQILCDDALDCAELREEIEIREESEFGIDPDAFATDVPENGPRRVHPRYSKTSACKDREAMEIIAESRVTKSLCTSKYLGFEDTEKDADISDDADRNFDECRLCGMDGTLICCDGCPSAYHGRCIGVTKMYIPEGPWYCPECTINKLGPTIIVGTSLRGAEVFGIDSYDQVFLGTCNHLLVLRTSFGRESCLRYYSQKDILKVLRILSATVQYRLIYLEICKAIADYWHIPQSSFFPLEVTGSLNLEPSKQEEKLSSVSLPSLCKESHKVPDAVDGDNGIRIDDKDTSRKIQADSECHFMNLCNVDATEMENGTVVSAESHGEAKGDSTVTVNKQSGSFDRINQSLVDRSSGVEPVTCTSVASDGSHVGEVNGACLLATKSSQNKEDHNLGLGSDESNSKKDHFYVGTQFRPYAYINNYMHGDFVASAASKLAILTSEETRVSEAHKSGSTRKNISDITVQAKAFSAVASRFFWPSSEKKHMEVPRERCGWCHSCKLPSSNRRGCMLNAAALAATKSALKILSGLRSTMKGEGSLPNLKTYILYMGEVLCGLTDGPFLSESYRKQWRKRVEDASTCHAVKDSLLDLEKHLRTIALSGDWFKSTDDWLVESVSIQSAPSATGTAQKRGLGGRKQRKQSSIDVADGADDRAFVWWRGGKILNSVFHKAILPLSMVKRMARKRYLRKISGVNYADDLEIPKRSKQLAWRAAVESCKNASHLALQIRCVDNHVRWNDLFRPEQNVQDGKGPETEASAFRNASICDKKIEGNKIMYGVLFGNQKHLPCRVMKNTIKVEQNNDGKDKFWFSETYVPLYLIKEYEESLNKGDLPSTEKSSNSLSNLQKRQLKASRKDIFLYLTCRRDGLDNCLCASCQRDVLIRDAVKCSICQGYIHKNCTISSTIYPNAESLACKTCCGAKAASHVVRNESLITPSPFQRIESHNTMTATKVKIKPLPPQRTESHSSMTATKVKIKIHNQPILSVGPKEARAETTQATAFSMGVKAKRSCNWGVIWKKKNIDDTGVDFRRRNVLLKGSSERNWLLRPDCNLCKKPYDCDKMYIHCETCNHWYHAHAVELEESKLPDLIGFKCCKCRRIKSPVCPYEDVKEFELPQSLKTRKKACKVDKIDPDSITAVESVKHEPDASLFHTEEAYVRDDDPLLFSLSKVEQISDQNTGGDFGWNVTGQGPRKLPVRRQTKHELDTEGVFMDAIYNSESGLQIDNLRTHDISSDYNAGEDFELNVAQPPKKLPVRRQAKHEGDAEGVSANNLCNANLGEPFETDNLGTYDMSCAEWGVPTNGSDGDIQFDNINCEDMEFEPQTYFSFTELLESEEGSQLDGYHASGNQVGNSVYSSDAVSHDAGGHVDSVPSLKSVTNLMHCKICTDLEPTPELCCEICGFVIHSTCSPWVESLPAQGSWRCGQCREWR